MNIYSNAFENLSLAILRHYKDVCKPVLSKVCPDLEVPDIDANPNSVEKK